MKKINKYQFGGNIDFSKLFEGNPLLSGYLNKANDFATKFTPSLTPSITTSILGEKPTKMDGNQFAISKGFDLKNNPFAIFKKGFGKLGKQYKEYNNQYNTDINNYNTQTTTLGNSMGPLLGSLSMLIQGMQGEKNYQSSNNDFIDDYQEGGSVEDLMNQDEFLKARGQIESGFNQDSVSSTGAVGMFQIMPIALKEYNRKYDSKYTWDQVKSNAVANAHVSNGLIKDIRSMINKIDTNLSDFDKNVLAEMAYNYGPYRFMDKLKAKGKNVTLQDMLNEKSLPTETRNHGKKFIDYFDKNRQLADKKVLAPRDNTRVVNTLPELKTFKGDPYEYKKEGTQYYFRKNGGEFKPINEAGKRELQRRKFQFGGTAIVDTLSKVANIPIQLFPNDTPENVFLDPKKHLVASVPDPTLIRSGLRQVYDRKTTKQIGFVNEQGQFLPNPIGRGMLSYEGTPPKINSMLNLLTQKQMGGNVNTTGYTPGTPTMNNDHNIIPSNQITMENTPFPVNAYPMNNGQLIGKPVKMKPGLNYYFPNANSVLEIPEKQSGGLISTEDGFSKRKGESRWGYKDNGDGTYSAIDYTRNGKQFLLSDPNNKAYKAVAALFPKSISQPTVNNNSNISTQSPARESSYISQYVQDNQLQTVPEPVQNVSLSQLPQGYNPYSYSGQPQTISQEQLNQNIPISYFDKNTALSGALATGLTIAPMGKVLSPLLGKLTSLFTSKKYVSPNNYKKLVDNIFDGVKKEVKEIPGRASRAKSKSYNEGVQKVFSGRNPVYEKYGGYISKYQYGGEAQEPELVPIQTEKGEKIYHLDGSISNVGAKKLHKNMDNDEITDVVLSGSFIASRDPQMKISKKEASNIILGNHAVKYEQGKPVKPPKDIKFSDIFKKRYHTPAQLTDIIDKKFKISDKPNNIFTKQANEWNKESRDQYMNIVKYMTEVKKPAESNQYKYGGKVEKHQLGGIISGALQLIPQVANMFTQNANKNATLSDISKYETQNRGYLQNQIGIGGLSNLLGYATQDLTPEIYDPSQVLNELSRPYNQALSSIPYRQNQNLSQSRAASNNAYSRLANIDPRLAYASASTIGSNGLRDANQINSQLDAYRDNLSTQLGQQRSSIVRDSLLNRQQTLANTRSNRNLLNSGLFSNFAQLGNDYYGGLSNINNTGLAARMGARGQYANFLTNMNYGMGNSLSQIANGISGLTPRANTTSNLNSNFSSNLQGITNNISNRPGYPALQPLPSILPRNGYNYNGTYIGE